MQHLINHSIHKILSTMHANDAYDFLCNIGRDPWHATKNHSRVELLALIFDYASECENHFYNLTEWFNSAHA